eukprot:CAMPEP_0168195648 /NCGR_PEP_ID=MMETSP0139_2-20121125/19977_1 /TAXON_ID=44445 /ORGANISM="Pseudo-nitzschia australis, Strain 10249 10 AB" /LENGTH=206 /DNA_ID=CAMNT_0008119535 /DNA_START=31 /DNA_END=651 /DNA_ORIENTATION=+
MTEQQQRQHQNQEHILLWRIKSNSILDLKIIKEVEEVFDGSNDVRHDDIMLLLKALIVNESIVSIRFEGDFLDCLDPKRRSELIMAMGSYLPSLQRIDLGDSPIFVKDLCHLVKKSESLRCFNLHDLILQGQPEDFDALESALLHHPSLKDFDMNECTSDIPGIDLTRIKNAVQRQSPSFAVRPRSPFLAKKRLSAVARSAQRIVL